MNYKGQFTLLYTGKDRALFSWVMVALDEGRREQRRSGSLYI
jgi:hypothetical protein